MTNLNKLIEQRQGELLPTEDELQKIGDHYWGGDYEPSYLELTRLKESYGEVMSPKAVKVMTEVYRQALLDLQAGLPERLTERNLAKVSDEYIFETEGECIAHNTVLQTVRAQIEELLGKIESYEILLPLYVRETR